MDEQQLLRLKPELDRFLERYAPLFGRDENQAHARRFVQGLLLGGERRNTENIAEALDGDSHESLVGRADAALYGAKSAGRNCVFRHNGDGAELVTPEVAAK